MANTLQTKRTHQHTICGHRSPLRNRWRPYPRSTSVTEISQRKNPKTSEEEFGFEINDYYIEHQGAAILDIDIDYTYKHGVAEKTQRIIMSSVKSLIMSRIFSSTIPTRQITGNF